MGKGVATPVESYVNLTMKFLCNFILPLALFSGAYSSAQSNIDTIQANKSIPKVLIERLQGVKYANMYQGDKWEQQYVSNTASIDSELMVGIAWFLKEDLGYKVSLKQQQLDQLRANSSSACEFTSVKFTGRFDVDAFKNGGVVGISVTFSFCDGSTYTVLLEDYSAAEDDEHHELINKNFQQRFPKRIKYDPARQLVLPE